MRPSPAGTLRRALLSGLLALAMVVPGVGFAEEPGKSWVIPALEVGGFVVGLNQFNRHFIDSEEYGTDWDSFWKNLTSSQVIDNDPFSINQLGHPYQGTI